MIVFKEDEIKIIKIEISKIDCEKIAKSYF